MSTRRVRWQNWGVTTTTTTSSSSNHDIKPENTESRYNDYYSCTEDATTTTTTASTDPTGDYCWGYNPSWPGDSNLRLVSLFQTCDSSNSSSISSSSSSSSSSQRWGLRLHDTTTTTGEEPSYFVFEPLLQQGVAIEMSVRGFWIIMQDGELLPLKNQPSGSIMDLNGSNSASMMVKGFLCRLQSHWKPLHS